MRKLRFGGPNLSPGQRTWFRDRDGKIVHVRYGKEVEADRVANAETYVARGQAEWVEPAAEPAAKKPDKKEN